MRALAIACVTMTLGGVARGESLVVPRVAEPNVKQRERPTVAKPAEGPRFRIGRPTWNATVTEVDAAFVLRPDDLQVTLTISMVGRDSTARDVIVPIQIPSNARAYGLSISGVGHGESMERAKALEDYRYTVEHYREDPALLELASRTSGGDQLRLRVYPVSKTSPMTVEITIALPKAQSASIDVEGHTVDQLYLRVVNNVQTVRGDEHRKVSGSRSIALDETVIQEFATRAGETDCPLCAHAVIAPRKPVVVRIEKYVDAKTSLLAGNQRPLADLLEGESFTPPVKEPTVLIGTPQAACCNLDKHVIKSVIERHYVQLRRCYTQAAQANHALAGQVVLKFAIKPDGKVTAGAFEGTLADANVRTCLANEVAKWSFPRPDATIEVNYPLTFKLRNAPAAP